MVTTPFIVEIGPWRTGEEELLAWIETLRVSAGVLEHLPAPVATLHIRRIHDLVRIFEFCVADRRATVGAEAEPEEEALLDEEVPPLVRRAP